MPKVTFTDHGGSERTVDADCGESVMQAARRNDVPGIDADCGGNCACATCHVYVDDAWLARTGGRSETEESMLAFAPNVSDHSRLSCQILVTEELDGLRVTTPESQS
ncbi:MAG: 2Fe-2S iron-sulfur cluster-binding protein [Candidatus Binatia bacterium]